MNQTWLAILAVGIAPLDFGAAAAAQPAPTTRPMGEAVRIVRSTVMESGRTPPDVRNPQEIVQHPAYQSWRAWGVGTRALVRTDEVDAQGRTRPIERRVVTLTALTGERAEVSVRLVQPDGSLGEAYPVFVPAQQLREWLVLPRRMGEMVYWRRLEATVEFDRTPAPPAATQPADGVEPRRRRARPNATPLRDPNEAIPASFECAILEMAYIDESVVEEGQPLPDDAVVLWRSYHSVHAPGWEAISEYYRGRLDENGRPTDLQLAVRVRIERILRPGEPDLTPDQLRAGLPLDR